MSTITKRYTLARGSLIAGTLLGLISSLVLAEGKLMVYPRSGQSSEQQAKDTADCRSWAGQQTGYDPAATTTERGGVARGGARGAAAGAAIGAIAGDAGKGAAIGATAGGMKKGFERRDQKRAAKAGQAEYDRALKTCLEGRGYSVN